MYVVKNEMWAVKTLIPQAEEVRQGKNKEEHINESVLTTRSKHNMLVTALVKDF